MRHKVCLFVEKHGLFPTLLFIVGTLSLTFSSATQFRLGWLGLSELFGLVFILAFFYWFKWRVCAADIYVFCLVALWVSALCLGALLNSLLQISRVDLLRESIALFYASALSASIYGFLFKEKFALHELTFFLAIIPLFLALVFFLGYFDLMNVWFQDEDGVSIPFLSRFVGWSTNPNQLGITFSSLPFITLYTLKKTQKKHLKRLLVLCLLLCLFFGILIQSNTVIFSWIFASVFALFHNFLFFKRISRLTVLLTSVPLLIVLFMVNNDFFLSFLKKGSDEDANGRYPIWESLWEIFSRSPFVGFGPGAHGGVQVPFQGWEMHSLLLDTLTQSGIFGVLCLIGLILYAFYLSIRANEPMVMAIHVAAVVEMMMHNTQRHPIFWFYLAFPIYYMKLHKTSLQLSRPV